MIVANRHLVIPGVGCLSLERWRARYSIGKVPPRIIVLTTLDTESTDHQQTESQKEGAEFTTIAIVVNAARRR